MTPKFLIWSYEHEAWWGPNSAGYTSVVDEAGRYDEAQADTICLRANSSGILEEVYLLEEDVVARDRWRAVGGTE